MYIYISFNTSIIQIVYLNCYNVWVSNADYQIEIDGVHYVQ